MLKLVTMNRGKDALLLLAAIFTILMMGTLPAVRATSNFSGSAYATEFWRSSPSCPLDLGSWIQARFITNTGITETGTQAKLFANNNGTGDFIFGENTQGYYETPGGSFQFPGVDAEADFHNYELYGVNLTVNAPVDGTGSGSVQFKRMNMSSTYNSNFGSSKDQLQILINQTTSTIVATYTILSSTGTVLHTAAQTWQFNSTLYTNPPPYTNYGVGDLMHGLEKHGYANV